MALPVGLMAGNRKAFDPRKVFGAPIAFLVMVWLMSSLVSLTRPMPMVLIVLMGVLFGLAMDYEVFLVARIREFVLDGHENDEAVALGIAHTGRIITAETKAEMKRVLDDIQSGRFARDWMLENRVNQASFKATRRRNAEHEIEKVGEKLREHLKVDRWQVFGGSWGSTCCVRPSPSCSATISSSARCAFRRGWGACVRSSSSWVRCSARRTTRRGAACWKFACRGSN